MSNIVQITCSYPHQIRADNRMGELQLIAPDYAYQGHEAVDDLLHHGYMLTRLPTDEIAAVVARANEILGQ